ncbi:hypothetical protein PISL3812_06604 [Talaromyces islandicus]|uniref:Uncharacterized protein n=1 Tax=Talaromyces islandicus TaxID=28573 RepID=A0A0U1M1W5_TALIS|nr:hypothetical protein PISL3812_06604 [Talaromyces islandicus]
MLFSALSLVLLCALPTYAITGGEAWVTFYRTCPEDGFTTDDFPYMISPPKHPAIATPTASPSTRAFPSASVVHNPSATPRSAPSFFTGKKSLFRALFIAAKPESTKGIRTAPFNITQGQCKAVPIVTKTHADSSSVSVELDLLSVTPFQQCNMTLHEVAGCIDEPLLTAPVKDRQARSECTLRNFGAWSDVWVQLDCDEVGTGSGTDKRNKMART